MVEQLEKEAEKQKTEYDLYLDLKKVLFNLRELTPTGQSRFSQHCWVALEMLEQLLAYYFMFVIPDEQK